MLRVSERPGHFCLSFLHKQIITLSNLSNLDYAPQQVAAALRITEIAHCHQGMHVLGCGDADMSTDGHIPRQEGQNAAEITSAQIAR